MPAPLLSPRMLDEHVLHRERVDASGKPPAVNAAGHAIRTRCGGHVLFGKRSMFQNLRRALYQLPVFFFLCTAVTLSQTGCADSKAEPVSSKTSKFEVDDGQQPARAARPKLPLAHLVPTATQQSDSSSKDGSAAQTGPDGDRRLSDVEAKALLFDVRGLGQKFRQTEFSAQGLTREQAVQLFTPMLEDIVNKSDQIVAAKADSKTRIAAADLKIFALRKLGAYTQKDANHDIKTFCRKLQNDRNDRVARFGERTLFVLALENTLREEKPDVATHHKKLARIIKANRNIPNDVGTLISEIMSLLVNNGFTGEAGEFALIIAAELKNSQDEQLVETAHVWESRAPAMILEPKLQAVLEDKEDAVAELQQWIKDTITSKPTHNATFKLVTQALQILEITGNYEIALESYTSVGEAFKDHEDADLAASVATRVARAERRLGLVGKPFEVSGVLTDGKPFEWAPYKGKVVLVDFWVVGFQDWHLQRLPEIKSA